MALTVMPVPEKETIAPAGKFAPAAVSLTLVPAVMLPGVIELTVIPGLTVNASGELVVEPELTVTLRAPVAAVELTPNCAVICVGLTTVTLEAVTPEAEIATVAPVV